MAKFAGLRDPVTLDFENSTIAYCVDAFSITIGALMGTSPVTAYIESATGISGTSFTFVYHIIRKQPLTSLGPDRGWQNRDHGDGHGFCIFHIGVLCSSFRFNPPVGNWWRFGHRGFAYDEEVRWLFCALLT